MDFRKWVKSRPRGYLKRLERESGLGWTTLCRAMRGEPIGRYETARKISEATGGEVSIEELCKSDQPKPERAAS